MKMQLILAAAVILSAAAPASAGDNGRTVCVLRARPVAIQPVYRPVVRPQRVGYGSTNSNYGYGYGSSHGYSSYYGYGGNDGYGYAGYGYSPGYYRVPAIYGHINPRLHLVAPCLPNGYVGGLRNLPTNYVQIPPSFTRAPSSYGPRPAYGGNGGNGGNGGQGGGNGNGGGGGGGRGNGGGGHGGGGGK